MTLSKLLKIFFSLAIAIIFLWLTFSKIDLRKIYIELLNAEPQFVLLALFCFLIGYAIRIERWRQMLLSKNNNLSWQNCAGPFISCVVINNLVPLRAGDILRTFAFNKRLHINIGVATTTLLNERLLDLLMLLSFLGVALLKFNLNFSSIYGFGGASFLFIGILLLTILFFPEAFTPILIKFGDFMEMNFKTIGARFNKEVIGAIETLRHLSDHKIVAKLIFLSALAWLFEGLVFWFSALALMSIEHAYASWLAFPVATLATLIPSAPGYIGTFDFFVSNSMTLLGNEYGASVAYAILVHVLLWLPITAIGIVYMLINPIKFKNDKIEH
jgi:uncharacterized protein (TIRG00374 family)